MLGAILGGIGSVVNGFLGRSAASEQADLQKQFAKNAIQWKVQDSLKAGIHPLYGLGANTVNYSPVQVGGMDMSWLGEMGQEIDRSRQAATSAPARQLSGARESLTLEKAGLENDLLRAEIAKTRAQLGPPIPVAPNGGSLVPYEVNPPQLTPGLNAGVGIKTNPAFSDAQSWEDRYGDSEIGSMLFGIMNAAADLKANYPAVEDYVYRNYVAPYHVKTWPSSGVGRFAGRR